MNVNATLIVQAINFGIAYMVISRYFLRPALELIETDEKNQKHLRHLLVTEQTNLGQLKQHKKELWVNFQNYFNLTKPAVFYLFPHKFFTSVANYPKPKNKEELNDIAESISSKLKEKVING